MKFANSLFSSTAVRGIDCSPGPVYFVNPYITRHGRDGTPMYSILGRQNDPNCFKTPSPGTYSPEKVHPQGERYAPAYSVGARSRYRKRDGNPAPNIYCLPQLLGPRQPNRLTDPSHSMTGRTDVGSYCEDLSKTPGPGQYNAIEPNIIRTKRPQYSMQGRSYMPRDNTQKPGPGQHSPEKVNLNKPNPPKPSLGIRHSDFVTPLLLPSTLPKCKVSCM